MSAALSLRQIKKSYGAVEALKSIDLEVPEGKVMAICGDNGAGKSTLIRIISGAQAPSGGELHLNGKQVVFASPHDALTQGIATIYQDLALAPRLSIWENIFMGAEQVRRIGPFRVLDKRRMAQDAQGYLQRLSVPITDMERPVERMSGGQRQAVAIARALRWDARVVIMDEPNRCAGGQGNGPGAESGAQATRRRPYRHPHQPQYGRRGGTGRPRRHSEKRHEGHRTRCGGAGCRHAGASGDDG